MNREMKSERYLIIYSSLMGKSFEVTFNGVLKNGLSFFGVSLDIVEYTINPSPISSMMTITNNPIFCIYVIIM